MLDQLSNKLNHHEQLINSYKGINNEIRLANKVEHNLSLIRQLDRHFENEKKHRQQREDELYQWFSAQLQAVKQSHEMEKTAAMERETHALKQFSDGLETL